ncbi:MAG: penicillin-binding protein [Paludibacteraceae bacterium]|nr:penicillin-binding protein [Paludibacteraceae bacterium]
MLRRILTALWILFGVGCISVVFVFMAIFNGWIGYMPPLEELQNPQNKFASEIYSVDLQLLGRFYQSKENRVEVQYKDISPYMINALIATEDSRFYDHPGIDSKALLRVLVKMGRNGGGSTITQQLAKQLYSPNSHGLIERAMQKPIEWVIALKLERLYTKDEIISMYLNQFDFLNNAVGIKSAAQVYFNTSPADLKIEEAATLVGMCKNPSMYNPIRHNERTRERRNVVLSQMVKYGYLDQSACDSLMQLPLDVSRFQRVDHKLGPAPYLREHLRKIMMAKKPVREDFASWQDQEYEDACYMWEHDPLYGWCNKHTKPDGTNYNIYTDGLKIYTTIDSRMQQIAEDAVNEHMQYLQKNFFKEKKGRSYAPYSNQLTAEQRQKLIERSMRNTDRYRGMKREGATDEQIRQAFNTPNDMVVFSYDGLKDTLLTPYDSLLYYKHFLRCGFMSMDPTNGHVKAYVGGPNFEYFQYDMVNDGRRQIGSTVKPYLYTLAMQEGMWPCDQVICQPITIVQADGRKWTPRGNSKNNGRLVTIRWGLQNSDNWVTACLMSLYTPEALVKLMHSFGIRSHLDPVVSLCLGICDISVAEMVDAYTVFPNKGIRVDPLYVTRIEDNKGNVIATFTPETHEIVSEETSYKMIDMMRAVIDGGTGGRIRRNYGIKAPMAGKTGTTQRNSDGWFMGYTPSLVNGCWVGGEDRDIHFDGMALGQGASMALPIVGIYLKNVFAHPELGYTQDEQFDVPSTFDPNANCKGSN